jgi:predicted nucleic acid-binding protein
MGPSYLIDTNIAIGYIGKELSTQSTIWLENQIDAGECAISIINWIEIFSFSTMTAAEKTQFDDFCNRLYKFNISEDIANQTVQIRQITKIKLPDALIAATAVTQNLTLLTRNTADFKNISGLKIINLFDI